MFKSQLVGICHNVLQFLINQTYHLDCKTSSYGWFITTVTLRQTIQSSPFFALAPGEELRLLEPMRSEIRSELLSGEVRASSGPRNRGPGHRVVP